jgi:hypothetical protein
MMLLFGALHTIASRRGDGLRPEFVKVMTQPSGPEVEPAGVIEGPAMSSNVPTRGSASSTLCVVKTPAPKR